MLATENPSEESVRAVPSVASIVFACLFWNGALVLLAIALNSYLGALIGLVLPIPLNAILAYWVFSSIPSGEQKPSTLWRAVGSGVPLACVILDPLVTFPFLTGC
jgi:hypothetical protein